MATYRQTLRNAVNVCLQAGINEMLARRLMLELTEQHHLNLYLVDDEEIDVKILAEFEQGIKRLCNHEPLAHILGYEWFFGRKFLVSKDVLVPREETEELIGHILSDIDELFGQGELDCADIGTGSGALAITLKAEEPRCRVWASDISEEALDIAKKNAKELECDVTFHQGDMAQPLIDAQIKLDICISNPPYIKKSEIVERSVVDFEPHVALFGGADGLDLYRKLLDQAPLLMKERSMMAFEMGFDQQEALREEVVLRFPHSRVEFKKDINGKDRMCFVYFNC
ncbi:MAG: peptide chain release factor N(5)-glutamine methyltransferase [Firmicutes bacterium HGW-Firmicutes-19]|nr:MAG: peptide chain release factor N(5)-glutamine methyltransferase [Firmicutes bacterium HGW-Firmicutes-19]